LAVPSIFSFALAFAEKVTKSTWCCCIAALSKGDASGLVLRGGSLTAATVESCTTLIESGGLGMCFFAAQPKSANKAIRVSLFDIFLFINLAV